MNSKAFTINATALSIVNSLIAQVDGIKNENHPLVQLAIKQFNYTSLLIMEKYSESLLLLKNKLNELSFD